MNTQSSKDLLNSFKLTGKTAMVTGAGKGIGRACAELLAEAGAKVIAVARTAADLEALEQSFPNQIETWVDDVTKDTFLARIASLDTLDILVNNVGTNKPQPFLDVDSDVLDMLLNINVRSAFLTAQAAARVMVKQGSGSIIHMSSQMGHVGAKNRTVYCTTKHAIEGLTKSMAVELSALGVRTNSVAPTFIETALTKPMFEDEGFTKDTMSRLPIGRVGQVNEVAAAVLFLASDASSMITGDSLKVDGGWTAV
ncbi:MAG: SDR family NAD(P)-dependent oxidoreductase [Porticoccaceae bacterium]|jgi:NAD(P)-dependent dehydrogenase (short-subunit alcohol dehydrogenase family)|nr:SDR family NAD(P)-dependent oxidoreductase [Porticoccaceae bacterium]